MWKKNRCTALTPFRAFKVYTAVDIFSPQRLFDFRKSYPGMCQCKDHNKPRTNKNLEVTWNSSGVRLLFKSVSLTSFHSKVWNNILSRSKSFVSKKRSISIYLDDGGPNHFTPASWVIHRPRKHPSSLLEGGISGRRFDAAASLKNARGERAKNNLLCPFLVVQPGAVDFGRVLHFERRLRVC